MPDSKAPIKKLTRQCRDALRLRLARSNATTWVMRNNANTPTVPSHTNSHTNSHTLACCCQCSTAQLVTAKSINKVGRREP